MTPPPPPAAPDAAPVLVVRDLQKTYLDFWRRPRVHALRGITFDVRPGEIFGLLGPNGSGKSTTIKLLLGLLFPTAGTLTLFGESPRSTAVKARIGYLPEETRLYPALTPVEILRFYAALLHIPPRVARDRIDQLLAMLSLDHAASRPLSSFSKGMTRRVALAQALLNDPDFLVLDEPTSGLDPYSTRQTKDLILHLASRGKTILTTSHLLPDVQDTCHRLAILQNGVILAQGALSDLLPDASLTRFTFPTPPDPDPVRQALLAALPPGTPIDVSHPARSLETYFLQTLGQTRLPPPAPFLS